MTKDVLRCSFCNKSQRDVAKLIAGPSVYICNECLEICNQIVAEDRVLTLGDSEVPPVDGPIETPVRCSLCQMPGPPDQAVLFPDRGWLCKNCLIHVQVYLDSSESAVE
jgi:hypothetical protein